MKTLPQIVRDIVDEDPDREMYAVIDPQQRKRLASLTYAELWQQAVVYANALPPRPRVLIVLPLGTRLVVAHLGVMLAGGVPSIYSHPSEKMAQDVYLRDLSHVLEVLAPDAVITNRTFAAPIQSVSQSCILVDEDLPSGPADDPRIWRHVTADDVALIQHSSGSTGLQKGVPLTHGMIWEQSQAYRTVLQLDPSRDRVCSWLPLYHDMGLFTSWLIPLLERIPVTALDPFGWVQSCASILQAISDDRGTLCWQPNFAYNLLATRVRDEELADLDLSPMRGFINCSEPVRAVSHQAFLDRFGAHGVQRKMLWSCYAMAEASFAVTQSDGAAGTLRCDRDGFSRGVVTPAEEGVAAVSCGVPIPGMAVRIVDAARQPLQDGAIGEVRIEGSYVLREYYRNAEATASAIQDGGYFTGDLGFLWQGELYITGRKKDLLIVGGRNFYPQDIEAVCDASPEVIPGRCVAIGVDDERSGTERIVLLVESAAPAGRCSEIARTVRQRVFEELDCPIGEVHVVPPRWLLKTSSGKIARRPNLERFQQKPRVPRWRVALAGAQTVGWGVLVAVGLFIILALQRNASWGVYAGF